MYRITEKELLNQFGVKYQKNMSFQISFLAQSMLFI